MTHRRVLLNSAKFKLLIYLDKSYGCLLIEWGPFHSFCNKWFKWFRGGPFLLWQTKAVALYKPGKILVQAPKELITELRTFPVPISENSQRSRVTQWALMDIELGTLIIQLTHQQHVTFPRLIYEGIKKVVGTRSLTHTFSVACNLSTSQPLYSKTNSLSEPSLTSSW